MQISQQKIDNFFTLGIFLSFFGPLSGTLRFWQLEGPIITPAGSFITLVGFTILVISILISKKKYNCTPSISSLGCLLCFLVLFFSDWICRPYSLVKGPEIRGEIFLATLILLFFVSKKYLDKFFFYALIFTSLVLTLLFLQASKGNFIFSDDHSVVTYRLSLLKENFPFIPFYNPMWNAGLDARDFFATGILNLFLIWSWLIYFFEVQSIYNIIICGTIFILAPALNYFAGYLDNRCKLTCSIAGILTLATSLFWYRWCLKYGSMGFVTATIFIPLNFILVKKLLTLELVKPWQLIVLVVAFSLMLLWSLTAIIFLPFLIYVLVNIKRLWNQNYVRKIILILIVLNLPWVIIFLSVSNVFTFLTLNKNQAKIISATAHQQTFSQATVKGKTKEITLKKLINNAREYSTPLNAVILSFGFLGIFLVKDMFLKRSLIAFSSWLLFLGFFASAFKSQLELDRMLIVLGFLLTIPASIAIKDLTNNISQNNFYKFFCLLPLGYILVTFISVGSFFWQRTPEHFSFADENYFALAKTIKEHTGSGRAVFLGFVLHELNQGHLAPLMQSTDKPLVASSLYHNLWRYTELVPASYLKLGNVGYEKYLDDINATLVIAHEKKWRDYLFSLPNKYRFIAKHDVFNVFVRDHKSNYFYQGDGTIIKQSSNKVIFTTKTTEGVISYNYFPFLYLDKCDLDYYQVSPELKFVSYKNCPINTNITLQAKVGINRVISDWFK